jgi:hypothetical protein
MKSKMDISTGTCSFHNDRNTLMMEAADSSETSVYLCQTTQCHVPDAETLKKVRFDILGLICPCAAVILSSY